MNKPSYITQDRLNQFIRSAIDEDVADGDHSTLGSVAPNIQGRAHLLIKEDCILAGVDLAQEIFHFYDNTLEIEVLKNDGDSVKKGDIAFNISGSAQSILTMERLVLNCMQRMSGIATSANEIVEILKDTNTTILDTRKTTPNFRLCEKWAVYIGGGRNHRFGLFDMIMLKDNHNDFAGSITLAVKSTTEYLNKIGKKLKIEVETRDLEEVKEALSTKVVDIIMLDNMSIEMMSEAVKLIDGKAKTEASGGILKNDIKAIASTGVDYISSGAIIYSAHTRDMSLKAF